MKFDIDEFWEKQKDSPQEKQSFWSLPFYIILFVIAQILLIAPFVIAAFIFGKRWAIFGWVGVGVLFLLGLLVLRLLRSFE